MRQLDSEVVALTEEVRRALVECVGDGLRLVVLYGSQARGQASPESDIDLLVVVESADPQTIQTLYDVAYAVMWRHDFNRLISLHPMSARALDELKQKRFSFIENVEKDGIVLWPAA